MSTITIIGPGAIGGTVAAWLAQDKVNHVSICARTSFDRLQLDTPEDSLVVKPQLFTSPEEVKEANWVLIATKAYDVAATVQWLPKLIGPSTRVAILQNGVEHLERFAPFVATSQLVPVIVDLSAERKAPGHIWQRSKGSLVVPANDNGREFVQLFASTPLTATVTNDFRTHAWRKLALNCTGVVPALLLNFVNVDQDEEMADLMHILIRECIQVGRAEGAVLNDALADEIIDRYRTSPSNSINSLHADRLAGRPIEIDARNGAVVRIGQKHRIDTPMNRLMVALLKAAVRQ